MKLFAQLIAFGSFAVSLSVTAAPETGLPALDRELEDLKRAYDAGAVQSNEWTQAKAEVIKWAR